MKISFVDRTPNYIMVEIDKVDRVQMYEAATWCIKNQCGKRVNWKWFAFKTEAELTMFMLRWT